MFEMKEEFSIKKIQSELKELRSGKITGEREFKITFEEVIELLKLCQIR